MSGITSGTGLISGIDTTSLIQQLLQIEARPRQVAQQRVLQLQTQQASLLDLNSRLSALKTAAGKFRASDIFRTTTATSSNDSVLTARASPGAPLGSFSFIVDRMVQSQQSMSRGIVDRNTTGLGLTSVTVESAQARLDRDTDLSLLNGGEGITRGRVSVTDSSGASATIDLSRVGTVNEVLEAFNSASDVRVRLSVENSRFVLRDEAGGVGSLTVAEISGGTTASSLGIAGTAADGSLEGQSVMRLGDSIPLSSLRDGLGIGFNGAVGNNTPDFTLNTRDGSTYSIDIGNMYDSASEQTATGIATVGQLRDRISDQTEGKVTLEFTADGQGFRLVDSSTPTGSNDLEVIALASSSAATDLGLVGSTSDGTLSGRAVLSGMNSVLASNLRGGQGLSSGAFSIQTRDGFDYNFNVTTTGSLATIIDEISSATGGKIVASLSSSGTSLVLTDTTGGFDPLVVSGAGAEQLGVAAADGVDASVISGDRQQLRYVDGSVLLSTLNGGRGVGTGTFEIFDTSGTRSVVDIGSDSQTIGDVIAEINSRNLNVIARVNDNGDGIVIEPRDPDTAGSLKIRIQDVTGTVGRSLNIVGEASGIGTSNFIDGSFERTIEVAATDTLDTVVTKINGGRTGAIASVINDGSAAAPFRLRLSARDSGAAGAFTFDTTGTDLAVQTTAQARNARMFFGSDDPAQAILLTSTTNTFTGIVDRTSIDITGVSSDPVTLNLGRDTAAVETAINDFVTAFNALADRLKESTAYNADTQRGGPLLGDSTALELRRAMYSTIQSKAKGVSGSYQYLSQVGIRSGTGGRLEVDSTRLRAALDSDPQGVADLFAAFEADAREERTEVLPGVFVTNTGATTYSRVGVAEQIAQLADRYLSPTTGLLTRKRESLDNQIQFQVTRIGDLDARLERRREALVRQFAGLESTLAQLQRQQSSLAGLSANRG
jgi:flagellar hook-associated protein 2